VRDQNVFAVDTATGIVSFGDGARGRRPPAGAALRADYDFGAGAAGNVAAGSIATAPALPAGIKVSNPVPTWGGAEAESIPEAEKQAARYLQHRDRLVTAEDFETIVRRTPGVQLGRVEVLPTFNPQVAPPTPTPGAVTLLVIPSVDALHPAAPEPDRLFLDAICRHVDPRRLVTTEVFLRGPEYVDLWLSVGVDVEAGRSVAVVREEVRAALTRFLAPVDPDAPDWFEEAPASLAEDLTAHPQRGWPLGKAVNRLELAAVASRVPGVLLVSDVQLAAGTAAAVESVPMTGLQLPRVRAISVGPEAADLDQVRGQQAPPEPPGVVPVPVIPETC
jgi:predicted phage baseplate assembly protein